MSIYLVKLIKISLNDGYLLSNEDESRPCHRKVTHIHMDHLDNLVPKDLVIGLPNLHFEKHGLCDAC